MRNRCLMIHLALLSSTLLVGAGQLRPDIIVTHLSRTPDTVTIHLQNLGPGRSMGKVRLDLTRAGRAEPKVSLEMPAPEQVFAVNSSPPIPLAKLGLASNWQSELLKVEIHPEQAQARQSNKDFFEQIERRDGVTHNDSQPYAEEKPDLPDLVIDKVEYEAPDYLRVTYSNRGRGRTGADFVVGLRTGEHSFPVNTYYRYRIPPPGQSRTTGGFTIGILGLKPGVRAPIIATIDPEHRVHELNDQNNVWSGVIQF